MSELLGKHKLVNLEIFLAACIRIEMITFSHLQFLLKQDLTNSLTRSVPQRCQKHVMNFFTVLIYL